MDYITDLFRLFSSWMRPHVFGIAMAMVATILIVFGNDFNRTLRKRIKDFNFFLRLLIFIIVCSFGYGMLAIVTAKLLARFLSRMSDSGLSPVVLLIFVIIGFIAERKNHM